MPSVRVRVHCSRHYPLLDKSDALARVRRIPLPQPGGHVSSQLAESGNSYTKKTLTEAKGIMGLSHSVRTQNPYLLLQSNVDLAIHALLRSRDMYVKLGSDNTHLPKRVALLLRRNAQAGHEGRGEATDAAQGAKWVHRGRRRQRL